MILVAIKHEINAGIGERVNLLLAQYGISQKKLCTEIQVPQTTLSGNLNNKSLWQIDTLIPLAKYSDVSLDYLITGKQSESEHYKQTAEKFRKIIIDLLNGNDNTKGQEVISGQLNVSDGTLSGVKQTP